MNTPERYKGAVQLLAASMASLSLGAVHAESSSPRSTLGLLSQAEGLPAEFRDHFFDVPLAVRVDLNGRLLGEAMLVLSRDERVQLLEFTDTSESDASAQTLQQWRDALSEPRPLGNCQQQCAQGLLALHYNLANSQLSILTRDAEQGGDTPRFHALPEESSNGLLLRNQLNLSGQRSDLHGSYIAEGIGSLGNWTTTARGEFDRSSGSEGQYDRYRLSGLHADRLIEDRFYRLGYFTPSAQGLSRQPRTLGGRPHGTLGVMFGSSDSLAINDGQASTTPIYVTPNRPAIVEVYRNNSLIYSQAVQAGLQAIDTRSMPGGIYAVEVRLVEDGQVTSRSEEFVYKPRNWRNPEQRWRYNAYLGQGRELLSNDEDERDTTLNAGVIANYLLHPRAVAGVSAERVEDDMQYGVSLDWDPLDRLKLYGSAYHSENQGNGFELQGIQTYASGSLVLSHNRSWIDTYRSVDSSLPYSSRRSDIRETQQTALSLQHRLDQKNSANVRVNHASGANAGTGVDLAWVRRGMVLGSDATWRFTVFDRPGSLSTGNERNRGVDVSLTMSLGSGGNHLYGSLGSRTRRDGGRDHNASLSYQQQLDHDVLRSVTGTLNADSYGVGVGGNLELYSRALSGNGYLQTSSFNGELSGGLNLASTLAVASGGMALSGDHVSQEAGMVVDVESDYDDLQLQAYDQHGATSTLKPGRNLLPVSAYKTGSVQLDFDSEDARAAVIQPPTLNYHLNKGGVTHRTIRVLRTVTVIGRLLDASGQPLRGAMVINHASRSVSEADGFFAVEMSESTPTLEVRHQGNKQCLLTLDKNNHPREQDVLLVGDLTCTQDNLAGRPVHVKATEA